MASRSSSSEPKGSCGAVNEQGGGAQFGKKCRALPGGLVRRMQRIGEQQQRIGQTVPRGGRHGGLPPAVGMAAGNQAATCQFPQGCSSLRDPFSIACRGGGKRRPLGALLAEGQVVAQHEIAGIGESAREVDQQRRGGVRPGAVSQDHAVAGRLLRLVQGAANFFGFEAGFHAYSVFKRRAIFASMVRGARRVPRIIQRLRQPAMTSAFPAIMAS